MKVQVVAMLERVFNETTQEWKTVENRIDNVKEIEFDPLNDKFAISSNKKLRWLILNKVWYRLSLKSYKECRKKKLAGV